MPGISHKIQQTFQWTLGISYHCAFWNDFSSCHYPTVFAFWACFICVFSQSCFGILCQRNIMGKTVVFGCAQSLGPNWLVQVENGALGNSQLSIKQILVRVFHRYFEGDNNFCVYCAKLFFMILIGNSFLCNEACFNILKDWWHLLSQWEIS